MESPGYFAPTFKSLKFNCPFCGAYARMRWATLDHRIGPGWRPTGWHTATGDCCSQASYWREEPQKFIEESIPVPPQGAMVYPSVRTAPMPARDMPEDVKADYLEAREVAVSSPRSAAALLRLAIQKLCIHLGEKGKNLNDDIGELVKKGLPVEVQRALDVVRVVGNNAVHPGELSQDDVASVADKLFAATNFIVQNRITQPNDLATMFGNLPQGAQDAIAKRDASDS
jgi:hypothetical protein